KAFLSTLNNQLLTFLGSFHFAHNISPRGALSRLRTKGLELQRRFARNRSHEFARNRRARDANTRPVRNRKKIYRLLRGSDFTHPSPHERPLRLFSRRALLHCLRSTPR